MRPINMFSTRTPCLMSALCLYTVQTPQLQPGSLTCRTSMALRCGVFVFGTRLVSRRTSDAQHGPKKEFPRMARTVDASTLSFSQKFSRLGGRFKDAEWRRYGLTLLGGKVVGVLGVLLIAAFITETFLTSAHAADAPIPAANMVSAINTTWTLVAAFLVFAMQVGFTM